jgi:hypothetical protein
MKIVVVTKKPVLTQFGRLPKDIPVEVNDHLARFLIDRGDAVAYETKVAMDFPPLAAGLTALSSAQPVAQVFTETTSSASEPGAKRRGRPRKEA